MHVFVEEQATSRCDCPIQSLSWMGKTPDSQSTPDGGGAWCVNESSYYDEGWLASGNTRGVVGVTFTSCREGDVEGLPHRTNFNLRGHRSEVSSCSFSSCSCLNLSLSLRTYIVCKVCKIFKVLSF